MYCRVHSGHYYSPHRYWKLPLGASLQLLEILTEDVVATAAPRSLGARDRFDNGGFSPKHDWLLLEHESIRFSRASQWRHYRLK